VSFLRYSMSKDIVSSFWH